MSIKNILASKQSNINKIQDARKEVADLKKDKIKIRSGAWAEATGTAKEKEDFVRSSVADIDKQIAYKEADIEYLYNELNLCEDKLVYLEDE